MCLEVNEETMEDEETSEMDSYPFESESSRTIIEAKKTGCADGDAGRMPFISTVIIDMQL